jgi:hypothetical protein
MIRGIFLLDFRKTYTLTKESVANLKIVNFRKYFPDDKI